MILDQLPAIPGILNTEQTVDPEVSRAKFDRELERFQQVQDYNKQRGIILLRASFPDVVLAFTTAKVRPIMIAFAVKINFTNYDLEAPSVQFIDPLTEELLRIDQLPIQMPRKTGMKTITQPNGEKQEIPDISHLVQAHPPHQLPFLCLPGVREYHAHPAHSNDPWLTHRNSGEGTLGFLIDQLHKYGTDLVKGYCPQNYNVQPVGPGVLQIQSIGLSLVVDISNVPS